jgi:hypothetical protein
MKQRSPTGRSFVSADSLPRRVASQEPTLFNDTIERNIAYGCPDITQEEIEDAAMQANAHSFIKNFPDGYKTLGMCRFVYTLMCRIGRLSHHSCCSYLRTIQLESVADGAYEPLYSGVPCANHFMLYWFADCYRSCTRQEAKGRPLKQIHLAAC